eukprot:gene12111-14167_t
MKLRIIPLITPKAPTDPFKEVVHENPSKSRIWMKLLIAEFLGVALLVFMVGGSVSSATFYQIDSDTTTPMDIISRIILLSLVQALAICALLYMVLPTGAILNPAVCIALMTTYRLGLLNALALILTELVGAIVGAGLLRGALPKKSPGVGVGHGIMLEMIGTLLLCMVVLSTAVHNEYDARVGSFSPWAVGCAVFAGVAMLNPFTGGSMNPARSFGPAVVSGEWSHHYVYWIGPCLGGLIAGLLYRFFLAERVKFRFQERDDIQAEKSTAVGDATI